MATNRSVIQRRIEIDTAHRVPDHGSKCFNLHGHRYVIEADVEGPIIDEGEQTGMVMDFGFLKECMMHAIYDRYDHGMVLYENDPLITAFMDYDISNPGKPASVLCDGIKLELIDRVPTAENLAYLWLKDLQDAIDAFFKDRPEDPPKVLRLHVWETPNCKATAEA